MYVLIFTFQITRATEVALRPGSKPQGVFKIYNFGYIIVIFLTKIKKKMNKVNNNSFHSFLS